MADGGIEAFWSWWQTARHRVLDAIEVKRSFAPELVAEIQDRVRAIDPELDWELGRGSTSRHAFFLSPRGDLERRRLTERWCRVAPPADATWSYFPARQAQPAELRLVLGGVAFDAQALTAAFEIDASHRRVHGAYWHPAFGQLDEASRGSALFLLLDRLLGEDGVERWLGAIELAPGPLPDARPIAAVLAAVKQLEEQPDQQGYVVLQGRLPSGAPVVAIVDAAIKRIDHLAATHHLAVELPVADASGLPAADESSRLDALEDELTQALGACVHFGRETVPGQRVLHWFVEENAPAISAAQAWAARRGARVRVTPDPQWEVARRFGAG
jgi:hypothetical protein